MKICTDFLASLLDNRWYGDTLTLHKILKFLTCKNRTIVTHYGVIFLKPELITWLEWWLVCPKTHIDLITYLLNFWYSVRNDLQKVWKIYIWIWTVAFSFFMHYRVYFLVIYIRYKDSRYVYFKSASNNLLCTCNLYNHLLYCLINQ